MLPNQGSNLQTSNLTGNRTSNPSVHRRKLNQLSHRKGRHLGFGFLSLATKRIWTKHPIFYFCTFFKSGMVTEREHQEEETAVDRSPTLVRSKILVSPSVFR